MNGLLQDLNIEQLSSFSENKNTLKSIIFSNCLRFVSMKLQ